MCIPFCICAFHIPSAFEQGMNDENRLNHDKYQNWTISNLSIRRTLSKQTIK